MVTKIACLLEIVLENLKYIYNNQTNYYYHIIFPCQKQPLSLQAKKISQNRDNIFLDAIDTKLG